MALEQHYHFILVVVETMESWTDTLSFVGELGLKFVGYKGDSRSGSFLVQRFSITASSIMGTFPPDGFKNII